MADPEPPPYLVKLFRCYSDPMKDWFARKPEDIETLRSLKAYLLEKRIERRAMVAGYARTYRRNLKAKREAADTRVCVVCGASMAHKRAGTETCSTKCRVKRCRHASSSRKSSLS